MAGEPASAAWGRPQEHAQTHLRGLTSGSYHATPYAPAAGDLPATGATGSESRHPAHSACPEDHLHGPGKASLRRAGKLLPGVDAADCPPRGYRQSSHGWLHAELLAVAIRVESVRHSRDLAAPPGTGGGHPEPSPER